MINSWWTETILRNSKIRKLSNLVMSWLDYRKAYNLIPHSWFLECFSLFEIATDRVDLCCGQSFRTIEIKRGILQVTVCLRGCVCLMLGSTAAGLIV